MEGVFFSLSFFLWWKFKSKCEDRSRSKVTRVQNSKVHPSPLFGLSVFYCVQTIFYTLLLVMYKIKNNNNNNQRPSHASHHTSYLLLFVFRFVSIYKVLHNKSFMQSHGLQYVFCPLNGSKRVRAVFCLFVLFFFEVPGFHAWKNVREISNLHCRIVYCKPPVVQSKQCDTWK